MTIDAAIAATRSLCAVLEAENAALRIMDLVAATAFVSQKQRATDAMLAAHKAARPPNDAIWKAEGRRLAALVQENKHLLERAMVAQNRVMACIARAIPRAMPQSSRYGAGGQAPARLALPPLALSNSA